MAAKFYFRAEDIYPDDKNGKPNKTKDPVTFEVMKTNFFNDNRVILRITDSKGNNEDYTLNKAQVQELCDGAAFLDPTNIVS